MSSPLSMEKPSSTVAAFFRKAYMSRLQAFMPMMRSCRDSLAVISGAIAMRVR